MDYTDLEDDQPSAEGIYNVNIMRGSGDTRKAKAEWKRGSGFTLLDDQLEDEEYIFEWQIK